MVCLLLRKVDMVLIVHDSLLLNKLLNRLLLVRDLEGLRSTLFSGLLVSGESSHFSKVEY